MPTWNWKKIGGRVVGLVIVSFFLAVLTDVLFMALQPVGQFDKLLTPVFQNTPTPALADPFSALTMAATATSLAADENAILDDLKGSLEAGTLLARDLSLAILDDRIVGEYILTISRTSPLADRVRSGEFEYQVPRFIPVIFGEVYVGADQVFQDLAPTEIGWSENSAAGTLTLTVRFEKETARFVFLRLFRDENQAVLSAAKDQFEVSFTNWRVVAVNPASDYAAREIISYDMNKHPNIAFSFEAESLLPTSVPTPSPTITPASTPAQGQASTPEAVVTRQDFMQKLDGVLTFAPVGSILYGFVEALPFLLFCLLVWKWKFFESKGAFYDNLLYLSLGLLLFHFAHYFASGLSSWWYGLHETQLVTTLSTAILARVTPFYNFFHAPLFGVGYYWEGVALLGIILPLLLSELANDLEFQSTQEVYYIPGLLGVWKKAPGQARGWLLRGLLWLILLLLVAGPAGLYFYQLDQPPYQPVIFLWMLVTPVIGLTSILIWWLWKILYRKLNGSSPTGTPVYLALLVLIALGLYQFLFIALSMKYKVPVEPGIGWGWFIFNTLLGFLLIYAITRVTLAAFNRQTWLTGSRSKRWLWGLALLLLVIPMQTLVGDSKLAEQFGLFTLGSYLDDLIKFIWLAGVVYLFYLNGTKGVFLTAPIRMVGILVGAVVFIRHTQEWFYIPVSFLLCLWLLGKFIQPIEFGKELGGLFERVFKNRISLLEEIVRLNAAERSYQDFHKELSTKLGKGEMTYLEFKEKIELRRKELDTANANARETVKGKEHSYRDIALMFGPKESAWENGVHGALWGLLLSLPWVGLGLYDYLTAGVSTAYPLLGLARDLLNLAIRWVGIGFILGYFYPYLLGKNGLMKALGLWLVILSASLPLALIFNDTVTAWQAFLLLTLQMLVHCILLGLIAFDFMSLRQGYREWQMLFEVHGLPSLGVSASTFVISLATSVFTLMQGQGWEILKAFIALIVPAADKIKLP